VNPFEHIPRLYDWEHDPFREDVDLYLALARRFGGPVLELACGTGRILAPLAAAGFACTGVDSAPEMLARARDRLAKANVRARLEEQRLESLELDGRFRTILIPLDGLGLLLNRTEQLAALRAARRHVTHDGRLVVDVSNGNLRGGNEPAEELMHHLTTPDPETGRPITKWAVRRPNPAEQLDDLTFFYDEQDDNGCVRRTSVDLRMRWFTRFELELLLEAAGWYVEELYGDYGLGSFGPASERVIVVAGPE
jgi:SAM-dependent methyltransferase